jgi:hypothetical protein
MICPTGSNREESSLGRLFGRHRHCNSLTMTSKQSGKATNAFKKPKVQNIAKKAPATQSQPRVPPSGASSGCCFGTTSNGAASLMDESLILVYSKTVEVEWSGTNGEHLMRLSIAPVKLSHEEDGISSHKRSVHPVAETTCVSNY